jgi:hypothetical protein
MYAKITSLASNSQVLNGQYYNNDPLTYCLGNNISQRFNHGGNADIYGQNSKNCQIYLAERCAKNWDDICEYAYNARTNDEYQTRADIMGAGHYQIQGLSPGEILLVNTAYKKYLIKMHNCEAITEPFDPLVAASPYITHFRGLYCVPEYAVDPRYIDSDPVMNRILLKPWIAKQLLCNIRNTMLRYGTLKYLAGTRLGKYYGI